MLLKIDDVSSKSFFRTTLTVSPGASMILHSRIGLLRCDLLGLLQVLLKCRKCFGGKLSYLRIYRSPARVLKVGHVLLVIFHHEIHVRITNWAPLSFPRFGARASSL